MRRSASCATDRLASVALGTRRSPRVLKIPGGSSLWQRTQRVLSKFWTSHGKSDALGAVPPVPLGAAPPVAVDVPPALPPEPTLLPEPPVKGGPPPLSAGNPMMVFVQAVDARIAME